MCCKPCILGSIGVVVFGLASAVAAEEPESSKGPGGAYGRTPDSAIPYRNFRDPYKRFFQDPLVYRGLAGSEDPSEAPSELPTAARIGFFGPTGSARDGDLGQDMLDGVTLAIEEANAAGGYDGLPFALIVRPDVAIWGASSNEIVAFRYEDDVLAVIGSIDGANTHIALRVMLKTQTMLVNTGDTDPTLTETRIPWVLRCMADDRQQCYALAHHIFRERKIEKVVAFRVNNHYGRMGIAEFRDAARRLKHPLRGELRWNYGDRDFGMQLDRIAKLEPDAIVLWGSAADTAAVVNEIRRRKMNVQIFGSDRLASRAFLDLAGANAEGVVAAATYDPTRNDARLAEFTEAFRTRFERAPGTFAAHGYDGAKLLVAAIRKAGLNRVGIRDAMYELTRYDGVTGAIEFDVTLNDIGQVYLAEVRGGKFVYRAARFSASDTSARSDARPAEGGYRTLAESPPVARSPERALDVVRVGCFLPLDKAGRCAVRGVRLALEDAARRHGDDREIELIVRDARGAWGGESGALVDLVLEHDVAALIGSTERRGTHLAEMLAAKMHFSVVTLTDADPTVHQVPLPWVFSVASVGGGVDRAFSERFSERYAMEADVAAAMGYDAGALVASAIRSGGADGGRLAIRKALASTAWYEGVSGTFRFDSLGRRVDRESAPDTLSRAKDGTSGLGESLADKPPVAPVWRDALKESPLSGDRTELDGA